jgi:hypothetical protein
VAQVASCRPTYVESQVGYQLVHVWSVGDKVALRQVFHQYCLLSVCFVFVDQPTLHNHITAANYYLQSISFPENALS